MFLNGLGAVLVLLALAPLEAGAPPPATADSLRQESQRRHEALIKDGYNLTYGWSLQRKAGAGNIQLDFLVPESGSEHQLRFWTETLSGGEVSVELRDPAGKVVLNWAGRCADLLMSRALMAGQYHLEIDVSKARRGGAEFGVKGPLMQRCPMEKTHASEHAARPGKGFHWPYLVYIPETLTSRTLLVVPNNTGFATESLEVLRASALCELQRQKAIAEHLGCPLLIPMFPRPRLGDSNLYLHALSREALLTKEGPWARVDLQLLAMIEEAQEGLKLKGHAVDPKVWLLGFSASGSFVNRFAMLHPERVRAVASGSPGGWPLVPLPALDGMPLPYPIGIGDLDLLGIPGMRIERLKGVRWFFYMGDQDTNDAVPYRDSFSKTDEATIFQRFGGNPVSRWKIAEQLYVQQGLDARFALYPNEAHSVSPQMKADIEAFFRGTPAPATRPSIGGK